MIKWKKVWKVFTTYTLADCFKAISDFSYDITPGWLYRFYDKFISYRTWKRRIKFFFQRLIRGFDDSETWDLDCEFYKWVYPRLKRFTELTVCWPGNDEYPTFESWKEDLEKRISQVKAIIDYSWMESEFPHREYLTNEYLHSFSNWKEFGDDMLNTLAYSECKADFNKWFSEHVELLWW